MRNWPFAVGDRVLCNGDWGVLRCDLSTRYEDEPEAVYVVHAVADGGRWLTLRDEQTGKLYGNCLKSYKRPEGLPGIGTGYFKLADDCDEHMPSYSYRNERGEGWYCARCGEPCAARELSHA